MVVAPTQLPEFLQRVTQILEDLPFRSFELLQEQLLEVVKEFSQRQNKKTFNEKTCSKHWWFNFIRAHEDIKDKWESIPLERSLKKLEKSQKNKKQASDAESEFDSAASLEGNLQSQISSPVHEVVEIEIPDFSILEVSPQMEEEKEEKEENINELSFDMDFFSSPLITEQTNKNFIKESESRNAAFDHQNFFFFDSRDFMDESSL